MKMIKKIKLGSYAVLFVIVVALSVNIAYYKKYDYAHLQSQKSTDVESDFVSIGNSQRFSNMVMAEETNNLELHINTATAEIAVFDKRSGESWYSNPPDWDKDPIANNLIKDVLRSQFEVDYFDSTRMVKHFYSYTDSAARDQFEIKSISNGIRIYYTLGDLSLGATVLPKYITKERLDTLVLDKMTDTKIIKAITQNYFEDESLEGFLTLSESAFNSELITNRIIKGFTDAGYTLDDLAYDNEISGMKLEKELQYVIIPLNITIVDDKLYVTVHGEEIEETDGIQVSSIELYPYFGAGGSNESGYMLVPNGSGSLINFNNGKSKYDSYSQTVYGNDLMAEGRTQVEVSEATKLPVFGINKGQVGILARITEGPAIAEILADVSGMGSSYNRAYARFTLRTSDMLDMSAAIDAGGTVSNMTIVEKDHFAGDMTVEYSFLPEGDSDYSGMARYYSEMLHNEGVLKTLEDDKEDIPFYLDLIGVAEKQMFLVGVPYTGHVKMTTYEQAGELLDILASYSIRNVNLRYLGWFNKGINNHSPENVKPVGALGTINEMRDLSDRLSANGGGLYPDVSFQLISANSKNYSPAKDSSRYLTGFNATVMDYERVTLRMLPWYFESSYNVVSPNVLNEVVKGFTQQYSKKIGVGNVALRDLGTILNSDKSRKYPINRDVAELLVDEQLQVLSSKYNLMISGGNQYALPYSQTLADIPTTANLYKIVDEVVPFYQMVIHGYADYTGTALNTMEGYDIKGSILHMIEYGISPHFLWSYQNSDQLVNSAHTKYYSTNYQFWMEDALEAYQTVNNVLKNVRSVRIQEHIIHKPGVRETVYENGVSIIANYTMQEAMIEDVRVGAQDFTIRGMN